MSEETGREEKSKSSGLTKYRIVSWCIGIFCLGSVGFVIFIFVDAAKAYNWQPSTSPSDYIEFGLFVGALLTPIVAAASLLLFWKTLRVQMTELSESTMNLKLTAQANQSIVDQNDRLFQLRTLEDKLTRDFTNLDDIENLMFNEYDENGKAKTTSTGGSVSRSITSILANQSIEELLTINKSPEALQEFSNFVNHVLVLSTDFLEYIKLGGKAHHFMEDGNRLYDLTYYLTQLFPEHISKVEAISLNLRLQAIPIIHNKLAVEINKIDCFLEELIDSGKYADDQPRYL